MNRSKLRPISLLLALAMIATTFTACESMSGGEQGAGIGALTGALIGAGVGYAIDDSAEGVIIGGLAGAMAGGIVGYIVGDKLEDRDETIQENPEIQQALAQPGVDEVLDIRRIMIQPETTAAGQDVQVRVIHSYVGPVERIQDFNVRVTLVDSSGRVLSDQTQTHQYENGTYSSTITFEIPGNLAPGRYGVDVTMQTGNVTDNASALVSVT